MKDFKILFLCVLWFFVGVNYWVATKPAIEVAIVYSVPTEELPNQAILRVKYKPNPICFLGFREMDLVISDWEDFKQYRYHFESQKTDFDYFFDFVSYCKSRLLFWR